MKKDKRGDLIVGRARMNGLDVKTTARKSGMKLSTLYKRIRLPGTMTIDEFAALDRVIRFPDDEVFIITGHHK